MLTELSIRNIVLIDRLDLAFSRGLSVLTGETGAGKSILLDALGLALGNRLETRLLRPGCDRGSVTATFQLSEDHPVLALLDESDIPVDTSLVLRRVLTEDGRSRAFLNDESVSINLLRRIGGQLVEIQGQFEERGLLNPLTHRGLLDAYGRHESLKSETGAAYEGWQETITERTRAEADADRARRDEEYLRHAFEELNQLAPAEGEEEQLAGTRNLLQNAEAVLNGLNAGFAELDGDGAAESRLRAALGQLDRIAEKAPGRIDAASAALERAISETQEAMLSLRTVAEEIQLDGNDLDAIESRLFALREVARKHGVGVDDLPAFRERLSQRVALLQDQSEMLTALRQKESRARDIYLRRATRLSDSRRAAAERLDAAVIAELPPLKLEKATFTTMVEPLDERNWGPGGIDRASFLIMTTPGAPPGPLSKIASGGELSRFILALKVVLAEIGDTPTLVFDEVDSGIGGATADAVGQRLARLAQSVQVLVVTHSPQVAARGEAHLRVEKHDAHDVAMTRVDQLEDDARREEVARMLSGREITDEARAAADRLLEGERL